MSLTVFLTGIGLSMDAFAVSVCKGLQMQKLNVKQTFIICLFFGGFQAIMPYLGWAAAVNFKEMIESYDHWIAFALLAFIGIKMIVESFKAEDLHDDENAFSKKEIFILAIATSIDALAVGIAFALDGIKILPAIMVIGITTFVLSGIGVILGHRFGAVYKNKAELAGGIILVLIGAKILLEHLEILNF